MTITRLRPGLPSLVQFINNAAAVLARSFLSTWPPTPGPASLLRAPSHQQDAVSRVLWKAKSSLADERFARLCDHLQADHNCIKSGWHSRCYILYWSIPTALEQRLLNGDCLRALRRQCICVCSRQTDSSVRGCSYFDTPSHEVASLTQGKRATLYYLSAVTATASVHAESSQM
jgi:hypothetical protein